MMITQLPQPPSTNDATNFRIRADEFLAALPNFAIEVESARLAINNTTSMLQNFGDYVGLWTTGTNAIAGKSYYYTGSVWICIAATNTEPTSANTNFVEATISRAALTALAQTLLSKLEDDVSPKLGGALDANGKTINKSSVRGIAGASPANGTTHIFDYANGDMQQVTCPAAGTLAFAFSNMPDTQVSAFVVDLVNAGNCTIIHPPEMKFAYGAAPTYTIAGTDRVVITKDSSNILTLTIIAQDIKVVS